MTITAQNLIEILQATAANTGIPIDELPVCFEDPHGYPYAIGGYEVVNYSGDEDCYELCLKPDRG